MDTSSIDTGGKAEYMGTVTDSNGEGACRSYHLSALISFNFILWIKLRVRCGRGWSFENREGIVTHLREWN